MKLKIGDLSEAEEILNKAFVILEDISESSGLIDYYRYKCVMEIMNKNFEKAQEYCDKSIFYSEESEDELKRLKSLRLKGNILLEMGKYDKVLEFYNSSIKLGEQLESEYECAKGYFYRAKINSLLDKKEEAKKDFSMAKDYISKVDLCKWTEKINNEIF